MCWSAKFIGDETIHHKNLFENNTYNMFAGINCLLSEADGVVTYNGDRFDLPQLNRGFVEMRLPRPKPYKKIDLYRVVRKHFKFASNKLDFVCQALGLEGKIPNKGMDLWNRCMDGDAEAWAHMIEYNKQDVEITRQLYEAVLPWIDGHPNFALHTEADGRMHCPKCGSTNLQKRGLRHTQTQSYQQYQCQDCNSWFRERYTLVDRGSRGPILTESS